MSKRDTRFALNENGDRIEVEFSGQRAKCTDPYCKSVLIGHKGKVRPKYWRHLTKASCDSWYEPISDWHIQWQDYFPQKNREIILIDKISKTSHRADIQLDNGLVIEIQNSPIKIDEIYEREAFYGEKNMIWILNGKTLATKSTISYKFTPKEHSIMFKIPDYCYNIENYNMDVFKETLFENKFINSLYQNKNLISFDEQNGSYHQLEFNNKVNLYDLLWTLENELSRVFNEIYGHNAFFQVKDEFSTECVSVAKDRFNDISIEKKYWRGFIDEMRFPVFFDGLNGLDKKLLYWYQENKIVKRSDFVHKYLKHT